MSKKSKYHSLRSRFIVVFCSFTLAMSLLYGALNFITVYVVEDAFIWKMLDEEANYLKHGFKTNGTWPAPRKNYYTLYYSDRELPEVIQNQLADEPNSTEFFGENGNHYHMHRFKEFPSVVLVAEMSEQLVVRRLRNYMLAVLAITTLIISLIACYMAFRLAKRTLFPLTKLASLFDSAAPSQLPKNFSEEFPNNEIGILANALDQAAQRTDQFVEREIQFTRDASHELRTPISVVSGAIEILKNSQSLAPSDAELIKRIEDANANMAQTVQALLTLAREESNALNNTENSQPNSVRVLPILEKIIVRASPLIENKNVTVNVDVPADFSLPASPAVLDILLWNLVSNAFQYTIEGAVSLYVANESLIVSDTGVGIGDEIKNTLFDPMVKGEQSQGFGIGLSIVKRLCEQQSLKLSINHLEQGTQISIAPK